MQKAIEMAIEIDDLPIKNGDFPELRRCPKYLVDMETFPHFAGNQILQNGEVYNIWRLP